jgi:hypothetical protein
MSNRRRKRDRKVIEQSHAHNEALSVAAMRISNPDRSSIGINR